MAQIPNLQSTNTLGIDDQAILRQGTIDKRISLNLAGILSWAKRNGYTFLGEHTTGIQIPDSDSFTLFNGQCFFVKKGVALPYTTQSTDPTAAPDNAFVEQVLEVNSANIGDQLILSTGSTEPRSINDRAADVIYVADSGASGDGTDQTAEFELAAARAASIGSNGKHPYVVVNAGSYLINSPISQKATWVLMHGAIITGLPNVSPTNSPDNSRLTGTVIAYDGIDQWTTVNIGDPNLTVQKTLGKSYSSEIMGQSDNSAGGVAGTTYTSARDVIDQSATAVVGIGVNDNTSVQKTVWGVYGEAVQENANGTCLAAEFTAMKKAGNSTVFHTPFNVGGDSSGVAVCNWLSAGGPSDLSYNEDITAFMGCIGKGGAMADKGILFYTNSVSSKEAIVLPQTYKMKHYATSSSTINAERDGANSKLVLQNITPNFSPRLEHIRSRPNENNSVASDTISVFSAQGVYNGAPKALAETKVTQLTGWDAGTEKASSRHEVLVSISSSSTLRGVKTQYNDFTSTVDGVMSCGSASYRWGSVFATTGTINTSDEREKTELLKIDEVERVVALKIKSAMRKFKFNDAVETKGEDKARIHFGVGAQTVKTLFEDNGLDPEKYALFCYDEWDDEFETVVLEEAEYETVVLHEEVLNTDGSINTPRITEQKLIKEPVTEERLIRAGGNRYGIRYEELLCFIIAAI